MFQNLTDPYERQYYTGLLLERRAKAEMRAGHPAHAVSALFQEAMGHFEAAERIRPPENDDAMLRWNRCARLSAKLPQAEWSQHEETFEDHDTAPIQSSNRAVKLSR